MKKHIANGVTLTNLFFGCCALVAIFQGELEQACFFLFGSLVADFADGFVARRLGTNGPLGTQLDSLADVVSFGVVPGMMLFSLFSYPSILGELSHLFPNFGYSAFLIPMFAAYRLGKFNLDTRQTDAFLGVPTPAMTLFVVGLVLSVEWNSMDIREYILNHYFLIAVILAFSWLMVSEIPLFSLKIKSLAWSKNRIRYIFAAIALLCAFTFRETAISLVILLYIGSALFGESLNK